MGYLYSRSEFFFLGKENTVYYIGVADPEDGIMIGANIFKFNEEKKLILQMKANLGLYNKEKEIWDFKEAVILRFDTKGKLTEEKKPVFSMKLAERPDSFMRIPKNTMQMRFGEAINFIKIKKKLEGNYRRYLVELQWRFAFPVSISIVILIGCVLGTYFKRAVLVLSFFTSIIIAFGYYGLMATGLALGKTGKLDPSIAAWIANIVYLLGGIYLVRMKK